MPLPTPALEHVADLTVWVAAPLEAGQVVGLNSRGLRRIIPITGGQDGCQRHSRAQPGIGGDGCSGDQQYSGHRPVSPARRQHLRAVRRRQGRFAAEIEPVTIKTRKGDVLGVAQLAGIMGAKRTPDLIPLCHPLALTSVKVELAIDSERSAVDITATCRLNGPTGVEMEALTAVSVAALTIYDMGKAVDRAMRITDIRLAHKAGGKSGEIILEE